jgi:DNA-binding GntR family transcriptional regulator
MTSISTLVSETHAEFGAVPFENELEFATLDTEFHAALARAATYDIAARHVVEWRNLMRLYRLQNGVRYTPFALSHVCLEHDALVHGVETATAGASEWAKHHVEMGISRCQPDAVVIEEARAEATSPVHA